MISDNFVTGDNVYLRELHDFFFEVLGMMSITHYGAIGDGRRDNYGPLQVAIDDAHRRGLSYLYVPYGRFIYTGELINMEGITFMGNPHAHIVNIRTGEEITIHQFGKEVEYVAPVKYLTGDLVLDGVVTLPTGIYITGEHNVFVGSVSEANEILSQEEMFYFDRPSQTLTTPFATYFYESGVWSIFQNSYIENEIVDKRNKIPTCHAVYEYIDTMITQAIGGAY